MKYFSLFSGIGGFELGVQQAYIKSKDSTYSTSGTLQLFGCPFCVGFSEIDKYAIQIYKKHFPTHKEYGDVSNITWSDVEDFELLCGGFPCQAFSIAGKRKGFSDTRGTLFFEIAQAAQKKQPRLLFFENVKGLLSHDKGRTFGTILNILDEFGYDLQWQVLNSKNFGVPQNRERVFLIGHLRGTRRPEVFPIGYENSGINENNKQETSSIIYPQQGSNLYGTYINDIKIRQLTPTECCRLQGFPDNWVDGISDPQKYKCLGNAVTVSVIEAIAEKLLLT